MVTSKKDAFLASKQLSSKGSTKAQKSVAGSDLADSKKSGGTTGKEDASLASKQLSSKGSTKAQKSVAGSDLAGAKKSSAKPRKK
jgi:hypothetical protein